MSNYKKVNKQILEVSHNEVDQSSDGFDVDLNQTMANNLPYEKPELICYGDVRDITLGPSPGFGESGAGTFFLLP